jgi:hypothetical protein
MKEPQIILYGNSIKFFMNLFACIPWPLLYIDEHLMNAWGGICIKHVLRK